MIPFVNNELDEIYAFTVDKLPELILLVFLPILIFESGRKKLREIRSEIIPIAFFAVVGVVATIFIVAICIMAALHTNFMDGILFGSIVAFN